MELLLFSADMKRIRNSAAVKIGNQAASAATPAVSGFAESQRIIRLGSRPRPRPRLAGDKGAWATGKRNTDREREREQLENPSADGVEARFRLPTKERPTVNF